MHAIRKNPAVKTSKRNNDKTSNKIRTYYVSAGEHYSILHLTKKVSVFVQMMYKSCFVSLFFGIKFVEKRQEKRSKFLSCSINDIEKNLYFKVDQDLKYKFFYFEKRSISTFFHEFNYFEHAKYKP